MSQLPTPEQQAQSEWLNARFGHLPFVRNILFGLGRPMPINFGLERDGGTTFVWPRYGAQDDLTAGLRSGSVMRFRTPEQADEFNAAIMSILQKAKPKGAKDK